MRGRSKNREDSSQNQFLTQPNPNNSLLVAKFSLKSTQSPQLTSKDQLIKHLEDRNQKLRAQLMKIQEVLQEKPEDEKREHKLIPFESTEEHVRRQLQNAYKHIKSYEIEIRKLEEGQESDLVTNRLQKLQLIFTQKSKHIDKMRTQIQSITKSSNDNAKKLKDNNLKGELQSQMLRFNEDVKFLRERLKDAENREKVKQTNAKKQYDYINKLEKELIETGCSVQQLDELKNRSTTYREKTDRQSGAASVQPKDSKQQQVEDLTVDRYLDIKGELKLLKKMQGDYEKKIESLTKEKEDFQAKNLTSRNKLIECQNEIEEVEREIKQLKTQVKPQNMRPTRSISTSQNALKASKAKRMGTSIQKSKGTLNHILKYDDVGITSDRGQRFTDRSILGKATNTKLVGVNVFISKTMGLICGIQSIYKMGDFRKPGGEYLRKDRDLKDPYYQSMSFECEGEDYIKTITGTLTPTDYLEYLSFVTASMKTGKFGTLKTQNKQFTFEIGEDEIPVCMFGSLLIKSEPGKKEMSVVEYLGFEINQQIKVKESQPIKMSEAGTGTTS